MEQRLSYSSGARAISIVQQSFAWMFGGLLVTAASAYAAASDAGMQHVLQSNPMISMVLMLAELGLVFFLSAGIMRMSHTTAVVSFLVYALLTGVTLSSIFFIYTGAAIFGAFLSTSLIFGVMALYGFVTKSDLSGVGSIAIMGVIGLIIASVVNMFLHSSQLSYLLSYLTIVIFCGLTAYDTQKIKNLSAQMDGQNLGIFGTLSLYLDFLNIFLALLSVFGKSSENED